MSPLAARQPTRPRVNTPADWVAAWLNRWLLTASVLGVIAIAIAAAEPITGVLFSVFIAIAWHLSGGSRPIHIPRAIVNTLLAATVLFAFVQVLTAEFGVELFSRVIAALLAIKMLDRRRSRDYAQALMLAVFLGVAAILTSNSFGTAVVLALLLPSTIAAAALVQIHASADVAVSPTPTPVHQSTHPLATRDLRRYTALLIIAALPLAVAIFIAMPRRLAVGTLGDWGTAAIGRVVGFNNEITLGNSGLISTSQEPVMDVRVTGPAGPVGLTGEVLYLRGAVLDNYERRNGRWTRGERRENRLATGRAPVVVGASARDWDTEQRITIRNVGRSDGHIFTLLAPEVIDIPAGVPIRHDAGSDELRVIDHTGRLDYAVHSRTTSPPRFLPPLESSSDSASPRTTSSDLRPWVTQPESAVVRNLTRDVLTAAGIDPDPALRPIERDRAAVQALRDYLALGDFAYTLDIPAPPPNAEDPIDWFLTESRVGHCEYYAAALALMCRSAGIPARVITGYVATDYNDSTGHYVVRASNAHAWVEAQRAPGFWFTVDGTPSNEFNAQHQPVQGVIPSLRRVFESIEFAWIRTVVGFDAGDRELILSLGSGGPFPDVGTAAGRETVRRVTRNTALILFGLAMVIGACVTIARDPVLRARIDLLLQWLGRPRAGASGAAAVVLAAALDRLAVTLSDPRPPGVPLMRHFRSLANTTTTQPVASAIADLYRARFAAHAASQTRVTPATLLAHAAELETLRRKIKAHPEATTPSAPRGRPRPNKHAQ